MIVEQTEDVVVVEVEVDAGTGTQEQSSKPKGIGKILPGIFVFNRQAYTPMYLNNN